jgi:hypothetical protein
MLSSKLQLAAVDFTDRRVLLRADFNVPLTKTVDAATGLLCIRDNKRILSTVRIGSPAHDSTAHHKHIRRAPRLSSAACATGTQARGAVAAMSLQHSLPPAPLPAREALTHCSTLVQRELLRVMSSFNKKQHCLRALVATSTRVIHPASLLLFAFRAIFQRRRRRRRRRERRPVQSPSSPGTPQLSHNHRSRFTFT